MSKFKHLQAMSRNFGCTTRFAFGLQKACVLNCLSFDMYSVNRVSNGGFNCILVLAMNFTEM